MRTTRWSSLCVAFVLFALIAPPGAALLDAAAEPANTGVQASGASGESIGRFVAPPMEGVGYATPSFLGKTGHFGAFYFRPGEEVRFFVGRLQLGSTAGSELLMPLDLVGSNDLDDPGVMNMARLLQSLDVDGDPTNGVRITEEVTTCLATALGSTTTIDFTDDARVGAVISATAAACADIEGVSLAPVSADAAMQHLVRSLFGRSGSNVSGTPARYSTKGRIEILQLLVPAATSDDVPTEVAYYDVYGRLIETRDRVKPIVALFQDADPETGALDAWAAISRDEGQTWKRTNLSFGADLTSFTLANGDAYFGTTNKPAIQHKSNRIFVAWTSAYCAEGDPRYARGEGEPYHIPDLFGVAGEQGSTNYTELGYPGVGEVPYDCLWSTRAVMDPVTGVLTWFRPERLTSGVRSANQINPASAGNAGFAVSWQEDPLGVRPGAVAAAAMAGVGPPPTQEPTSGTASSTGATSAGSMQTTYPSVSSTGGLSSRDAPKPSFRCRCPHASL
jgi:hypothetical protein